MKSLLTFLSAFGIFGTLFISLNFSAHAAFAPYANVPSTYKNIGTPQGMVLLSDGSYWFTDNQSYRVIKASAGGQILRTVGKQGSDFGEFSSPPQTLTLDDEGILHVAEYNGCKINKFDSNGGFISSWGSCGDDSPEKLSEPHSIHYSVALDKIVVSDSVHNRIALFETDGTYVSAFGTSGTADGQFDGPRGVTTDAAGYIYVVDENNSRVQIFDSAGNFDRKFGEAGGDPGDLTAPKDVKVLTNGNIVVTSQNSQRINIYSSTGVFITEFGSHGTGDGQFVHPQYLAVNSSNEIYVTDAATASIQKFNTAGDYLSGLKNGGLTPNTLSSPTGVAYDDSGNLYVLDNSSSARVQKFTTNGVYVSTVLDFGEAGNVAYHLRIHNDKIYVSTGIGVNSFDLDGTPSTVFGGTSGSGEGEFGEARGTAIDASNNVYVADFFNHRVQIFNSSGTFVDEFGTEGTGDTQFTEPDSLALIGDVLYVADALSVKKYDIDDLSFQGRLWNLGVTDENLGGGRITAGKDGKIYYTRNCGVEVYNTSGDYEGNLSLGCGGGKGHFGQAVGLDFDYTPTVAFAVADQVNNRVVIYKQGTRITNLVSSADVLEAEDEISLVNEIWSASTPDIDNLSARMQFGDYVLSDFEVDLTADRDWSEVNGLVSTLYRKSLVVNLNPSDAPGISADHALYVAKEAYDEGVYVCPDATVLDEVVEGCTNGYQVEEGDADVSVVTIDGTEYWRIDNLTGTGILALEGVAPSPTPASSGGSGSSGSTLGAASAWCGASLPIGVPDLFQINRAGTQVTLYINPKVTTYTGFVVNYGTNANTTQYSDQFTTNQSSGVIKHVISWLDPNSSYSFKVQAFNQCIGGSWSNTITVGKTSQAYFKSGASQQLRKAQAIISDLLPKTKAEPTAQPVPAASSKPTTPIPSTSPVPQQESPSGFWGWVKSLFGQ